MTSLIFHAILPQYLFVKIGDFPLFGSSIIVVACRSSVCEVGRAMWSGNQIADIHIGITRVIFNHSRLTFCTTWEIRFHGGQQQGFLNSDQL
ncbi:hypothetical protein AYI70_g11477 [Smittium culicis]|uniref:Uncharacterized protein n=1 Tax=Smittium culicis TaxID=133412 RepID=A0A1R1X1Q0_9FUNG|nr:hypothetical protein AYI70_g11477 [Smittium culicis]